MKRFWVLSVSVFWIISTLVACQPAPTPVQQQAIYRSQQFRRQSLLRSMSAGEGMKAKDYIKLTKETILDELKTGDAKSLQTFIQWGKTQKEYFKGSRNIIAKQLINQMPLQFQTTSNYVQQLEQLIKSPQKQFEAKDVRPINFNIDQGKHLNKLSEWWYYNGHMNTVDGRKYGYELCFFRVAPVIYFAHIAVTDENKNEFKYKRSFFRPKRVAIKTKTNDIRYGDWVAEQIATYRYRIEGTVENFKFDLNLDLTKEPMIINGNGLIDMPEGTNSYYYSLTRLNTRGFLTIDGQKTPVSGQSWMDHQWGNFIAWRIGWDWFSFQMDDGTEYNLFGFRKRNGKKLKRYVNVHNAVSVSDHSMGFKIKRLKWWTSPKTGRLYVTKWKVTIPQRQETFIVEATNQDQEVASRDWYDLAPTYWEGSCNVTKIKADGTKVKGQSYVEHFDYTKKVIED